MYAVPVFVTLEGPEGAGKSSVLRALIPRLEEDYDVVATREPGDTKLGAKIRTLLLDGDAIDSRTELLLFLADRAQHVAEVVRPALSRGALVLCDRYTDSTLAYQGYARDFDLEILREWNQFVTNDLAPDLTLLFDIDPEVGLGRITNKDRLDAEPLEFHQKVRQGFLSEALREPHRWVTIDASQSLELVVEAACAAILHGKPKRL